MKLEWESADHDDAPMDQNASTEAVPHGYWQLGDGNVDRGGWSVDLVVQAEDLQEIDCVSFGKFSTEKEAKAAAQAYEDQHEMDSETECEGHESLRGDSMGLTVYCDGSCR